jgi:hypothetical protein
MSRKGCPQKARDHQGDYHKVFHGGNYVDWWTRQLLPNLTQPSLIILDNAKYHLVYGNHVPKWSKMKKQECIDYLRSKQVEVVPTMTAVELKQQVRQYIEQHEKPEIIRLAELAGHKVLFTPPYHSDLQPIELAWAYVKGKVGRQYSNGTTLEMVHQRLLDAFRELEGDHSAVAGMIRTCTELAQKFHSEIALEEELDDADSDVEQLESDEEDEDDQIEGFRLFPSENGEQDHARMVTYSV